MIQLHTNSCHALVSVAELARTPVRAAYANYIPSGHSPGPNISMHSLTIQTTFVCYTIVPQTNNILSLIYIYICPAPFSFSLSLSLSFSLSLLLSLSLSLSVEDMSPDCGSQSPRFKSHRGTNVLWQDIDLHLPLSTQVLNGYPVECES